MPTASSSRCSTASAAICRAHSSTRATASGCTSPSAASGSRTSCGGWANGRPTSPSSCAASPLNAASGHTSMDKVIAITGASAGIGRATALRLARDGAAVVVCARRQNRLEEVGAEIERAGGQALPVVADVTREADMHALVASACQRFGRLDVMMCNAGFGIYGTIDTIAPAEMRRLLDVNYLGTYHAVRAALPVFRRQ